jgi:hypothetical protein
MPENFGDVPIAVSHGGRRSLPRSWFARARRRCVKDDSEPDASAKHGAERAVSTQRFAPVTFATARPALSTMLVDHDTQVAPRGPVGSPATVSSSTSPVRRAPVPIGNAR